MITFKQPRVASGLPRWLGGKESYLPMQNMRVQSLGWEYSLMKKMAIHSGISCLGNPLDRGAWQSTVHGVAKNQTRLSDLTATAMWPVAIMPRNALSYLQITRKGFVGPGKKWGINWREESLLCQVAVLKTACNSRNLYCEIPGLDRSLQVKT